ncbi:MAG: hypothetical protein RSA29_09100 [Clostridium sp.]
MKEPEQAEKYMILLVDLQLKIHDIKAEGHHLVLLGDLMKEFLGEKYRENALTTRIFSE